MKYLFTLSTLLILMNQQFAFASELKLNEKDRDAIARVAIAEAGNQGTAGISGVIFVILNRLQNGGFGNSVTDVLNAPGQFEPVSKVKGWDKLPKPTEKQLSEVETILNLAISGHFADPTKGALYFQNPEIVAKREAEGKVSQGLTHFGGAQPSAVINNHAFYPVTGKNQKKKVSEPVQLQAKEIAEWDAFNNSKYKQYNTDLKAWK